MKTLKIILGVFAASMFLATPAFADMKESDFSCPLSTFDGPDLVKMANEIATESAGMSEALDDRLNTQAASCQKTLGWTDEQTQKILQYDVARMVAIYYGDVMEKGGLDLAPFNAIVDGADMDKLRVMIGSDDKDPKLDDAVAELTKQKGSDIGDDLAGAVGGYVSGSAQAKFFSLELLSAK